MKKNNIIFLALLFIGFNSYSQSAAIDFEEITHDFGTIKEEDGAAVHEFKFKNTGNVPVIVNEVKASCGCTTPGWTKEPVMPGKTGFVKASFDTQNRPGSFSKNLTVTANTEPSTMTLTIKGIVVPKAKSPADEFRDTLGSLRMSNRNLDFGSINNKEPITKEFKIYNNGAAPVTIFNPAGLPKHVKAVVEPKIVQPKQTAVLKITFDPKTKNDFGYVSDQISLSTNDPKGARKNLMVSGTISEYFPPLTEADIETAPKITFVKSEGEFGTVKAGQSVATEFEFSNTGKKDLIIRKVASNCKCIVGTPDKKVLKPGEKAKVKISYNSTGRSGADSRNITVYSNDPTDPMHLLVVKANVTK